MPIRGNRDVWKFKLIERQSIDFSIQNVRQSCNVNDKTALGVFFSCEVKGNWIGEGIVAQNEQ